MYGSLSSRVDLAFSIDLQDAYLHVPITKHHHCFLHFVWHNVPYQWKVLPFGIATAPRVFTSLTKPILFLCCCKVCILLSIWMTSWSSFALSGQVRGHTCFCVPCWSVLVYTSMCATQTGVLFLGLSGSGGATRMSTSRVYQQC